MAIFRIDKRISFQFNQNSRQMLSFGVRSNLESGTIFYSKFDTSPCTRKPEFYQAVVKNFETESKKEIRKIGICLKEGEFRFSINLYYKITAGIPQGFRAVICCVIKDSAAVILKGHVEDDPIKEVQGLIYRRIFQITV